VILDDLTDGHMIADWSLPCSISR